MQTLIDSISDIGLPLIAIWGMPNWAGAAANVAYSVDTNSINYTVENWPHK